MSKTNEIYQRVIVDSDPLIMARAAIDKVKDEKRSQFMHRLRGGELLDDIVEEPIEDGMYDFANQLLEGEADKPSVNWVNWFGLKRSVELARPQIFGHLAFSEHGNPAVRTALHTEAYKQDGRLLGEVVDKLSSGDVSETAQDQLYKLVDVVLLHALLNRMSPAASGGYLPSAVGQYMYGVDAILRQTSSSIEDPYRDMRFHVHSKSALRAVTTISFRPQVMLKQRSARLRLASAIGSDAQGYPLNSDEQLRLNGRVRALKQLIASAS